MESSHALPCHTVWAFPHQCHVRGFLYARLALAARSADIAFLSQRSACPTTPSPLTCARAWESPRVPSGATTPQRSGRCSKTRVSIPPCPCPSSGITPFKQSLLFLFPRPSPVGLWQQQQPEALRLRGTSSHAACLRVTQYARIALSMMQFVTLHGRCRHVVRGI